MQCRRRWYRTLHFILGALHWMHKPQLPSIVRNDSVNVSFTHVLSCSIKSTFYHHVKLNILRCLHSILFCFILFFFVVVISALNILHTFHSLNIELMLNNAIKWCELKWIYIFLFEKKVHRLHARSLSYSHTNSMEKMPNTAWQ